MRKSRIGSEAEMKVYDFSNRGLHSIEFIAGLSPQSLNYDGNFIKQLENLHHYENLTRLSVAGNQISDMTGVAALRNLTILDLSDNNISLIQGLRHLSKLSRLNLSRNKIKQIENLSSNTNLLYLDLSENAITSLSDIRGLTRLRMLLLHGNQLVSLRSLPETLTRSIVTLSLANNSITDLNEVSHLYHMSKLEQLSILGNPCVMFSDASLQFDYRPFLVNWCVNLQLLDGQRITEKEGLKAEWLFSQGKGRHFTPGQHFQLCQYLTSVCPVSGSELDRDEDVKLKCILKQQRFHQQQRQGNSGHGNRTPATPSQSSPKQASAERKSTPSSVNSSLAEKPLYFAGPGKGIMRGAGEGPGGNGTGDPNISSVSAQPDLIVEEISSSDESQSLLESETRYLPVLSEYSLSPSSNSSVVDVPVPATDKNSVRSPSSEALNGAGDVGKSRQGDFPAPRPSRVIVAISGLTNPAGSVIKPVPSVSQPQSHIARKRSPSPVTKTIDVDSSNASSIASDARSVSVDQRSMRTASLNLQKLPRSVQTTDNRLGSSHSVSGNAEDRHETAKKSNSRKGAGAQGTSADLRQTEEDLRKSRAAVTMQAFWRGCMVRKGSQIARDIHLMRSEDHIRRISSMLNSQSRRFENQKLFWSHQVELLKHLVREVQSLQDWKNQVVTSQDQFSTISQNQSQGDTLTSSNLDILHHKHSSGLMMDLNPQQSLASPKPTRGQVVSSASEAPLVFQFPSGGTPQSTMSQRESELEQVCLGLQKQVDELKETVLSLSSLSAVFCGSNVVSASGMEDDSGVNSAGVMPLPPAELSVGDVTSTSAVVKWKHHLKQSVNLKSRCSSIIGYRVYVNNEPWAMVASSYNSAVLSSLIPNTTYNVYVKAVGSLGDSGSSDEVEFRTLSSGNSESVLNDPSSSCDNSDKAGTNRNMKETSSKRIISSSIYGKSKENTSSDQSTSSKQPISTTAAPLKSSTKLAEQRSASIDGSARLARSTEKNQTCPPTVPPFLKDEHPVKPTSTYPARKAPTFSILENKMEITEATKNSFLAGISKAVESDTGATADGEEAYGDEQGTSSEIRYVPKPPDDAILPRRNSMNRRSSGRRRSNNKTPTELHSGEGNASHATKNDEADVTTENSKDVYIRSPSEPVIRGEDGSGPCRSRQVSNISSASESRSSSVGSRRRRDSGENAAGFTVDKPPTGPRDSSSERSSGRKRTMSGDKATERSTNADFESLKCKSEVFSSKPNDQNKPQVIQKPAKDEAVVNKASKSFFSHSRSKSDFKMLPDHPKSPVPIEKSTVMSTPPQAPSSPQFRRSSSFSTAIREEEKIDAKTQLRQCISLETLRAVKKSSSSMVESKQTTPAPDATDSKDCIQTQQISEAEASESTGKKDNSPNLRHSNSMDQQPQQKVPSGRLDIFSAQPSGVQSPGISHSCTPLKVSSKKSDSGSKSRLGNKASNLFSQLQKKISSNK